MSQLQLASVAVASGLLVVGCSFGTFQTGHTQAPGTLSATAGMTLVANGIDSEAGRSTLTNLGAQLSGRLGIARHVDLGLGTFMLTGLATDVKVNLLAPSARWAIAPRLGAGLRLGREVRMLEGGAITSYALTPDFEPYFGLTFANHWIEPEAPTYTLPPNLAPSRRTGDGVLQLCLGFEARLTNGPALLAEFQHWFPLNDNPGDFYRFVPTNIFGMALRFGRVRAGAASEPAAPR